MTGFLEVKASGARAKSGDDVVLLGGFGLDVVGEVVGIVAGEDFTARHGALGLSRVHLLDAVLIVGVDNGGDVEEGQAVLARELDLAEHASLVLLALGDGVEVTDEVIRELDSLLLRAVDRHRVQGVLVVVGSEVDGTLNIV